MGEEDGRGADFSCMPGGTVMRSSLAFGPAHAFHDVLEEHPHGAADDLECFGIN